MAEKFGPEKWKALIEEWEVGDLTRKEFCKQNDLVLTSFDYWRRRLNNKDSKQSIVRIGREPCIGRMIMHYKVFKLEIPENMKVETLKNVLSVLKDFSC